jgi:S-methylmethionine-dependent homocysteine/selenocysteine methylase
VKREKVVSLFYAIISFFWLVFGGREAWDDTRLQTKMKMVACFPSSRDVRNVAVVVVVCCSLSILIYKRLK